MKAIRIHEFGGPEVLKLEDAPKPEPAPGEILIKLYASGVNPVDYKIRAGQRKERFPTTFPLTLGWDASGVVEQTGNEIKHFKPGDEVYTRPDSTKNGTYAEYVIAKEFEVGLKPKKIDHIQAAGFPLAGLTAWQALFDHGKLEKGQKVLIHAASGGVGIFAVQFAKWKGAHVIGTTSEKNIELVKELGADEVIDYKNQKFENILNDIDLVIDTIGGETQKKSIQVLKNGGRLITTLFLSSEEEAKQKNIHTESFIAKSYTEQLEKIAQLIDDGTVKPVISKVLSLEDAAEAHRLIEQGHTVGKIILKIV